MFTVCISPTKLRSKRHDFLSSNRHDLRPLRKHHHQGRKSFGQHCPCANRLGLASRGHRVSSRRCCCVERCHPTGRVHADRRRRRACSHRRRACAQGLLLRLKVWHDAHLVEPGSPSLPRSEQGCSDLLGFAIVCQLRLTPRHACKAPKALHCLFDACATSLATCIPAPRKPRWHRRCPRPTRRPNCELKNRQPKAGFVANFIQTTDCPLTRSNTNGSAAALLGSTGDNLKQSASDSRSLQNQALQNIVFFACLLCTD